MPSAECACNFVSRIGLPNRVPETSASDEIRFSTEKNILLLRNGFVRVPLMVADVSLDPWHQCFSVSWYELTNFSSSNGEGSLQQPVE
jgi:hypothetical protein